MSDPRLNNTRGTSGTATASKGPTPVASRSSDAKPTDESQDYDLADEQAAITQRNLVSD